jgi:hypothetical protein
MITLQEYYMGREVIYSKDFTASVMQNAERLIATVNQLLSMFGEQRKVNSGWRPKKLQMEINPRAPNSKHITGDAIDLEDRNGKFKLWCVAHENVLESLGLHMEHPKATPTWVHLQQVAPKSGKVIFVP